MGGKTENAFAAGDLVVAIASLAKLADPSTIGTAKTAFGALRSGVKLISGLSPDQETLATSMAAEMVDYLDQSHLSADRRKIAVQVLSLYPPSETDLAKGNMDATTIAGNMRANVEAKATDTAHKTGVALDDYASILTATLAPFLVPKSVDQAILRELLARSKHSGQSDRLRDEGITEKAIIRLAQRIAGGTEDLGQAWLELQNAMDIAVRVQREGRFASNRDDFVNEVLKHVADLAAEGEFADASAEISKALATEDAEHQARKTRLLESGIEVAMLEGDSVSAARLLVQKADLDAGGNTSFGDLRKLQDKYVNRGRDKGIALDLRVAIELARFVLTRAARGDDRGAALNDLGNALAILGERETGTARLDDAVTAFENALKERTRERAPLDWARTQNNLGNALRTLGARETGTAQLHDAVTAYRNALKEWTRERVPLDWAGTQCNLGTALAMLGARETGTARLDDAVVAYENALKEWTRKRVPFNWAMTRHCQSGLSLAFFRKTGDTAHLVEARQHAKAAQAVYHEANAEHYINWIAKRLAAIDRAEK